MTRHTRARLTLVGLTLAIICVTGYVAVPGATPRPTPRPSPHYGPHIVLPSSTTSSPASYVQPFVGTAHYGYTFPGASVPFGMVQWSPDTERPSPAGYSYADNRVRGFSLTHLSGAGCPTFQDLPFLPAVGPVAPPTRPDGLHKHDLVAAEPTPIYVLAIGVRCGRGRRPSVRCARAGQRPDPRRAPRWSAS